MLALSLRCRLSVPVPAPRDLPVEPLNRERLAEREEAWEGGRQAGRERKRVGAGEEEKEAGEAGGH